MFNLTYPRKFYTLAAILTLALTSGCSTAPNASDCEGVDASASDPALDKIIAELDGKEFRSLPYLQLAIALQTMPHAQAENQLRTWACSGQHTAQITNLCRLLFVGKDGQPLSRVPPAELLLPNADPAKPGMYSYYLGPRLSFGRTSRDSWPDWPLALVNGVPFFIGDGLPLAGSFAVTNELYPHAIGPEYLAYCLKEGQWTTYRYQIADLAVRQQALVTLLNSPTWRRSLAEPEIKYLTNEISEEAAAVEPKPVYLP